MKWVMSLKPISYPGFIGSSDLRLKKVKTYMVLNPTSHGVSDPLAPMGGGASDDPPPKKSRKESFLTPCCHIPYFTWYI